MAETGMFGGTGGLMRYKEEYNSKFKIKPSMVIGLVVITVVLELLLHFFI